MLAPASAPVDIHSSSSTTYHSLTIAMAAAIARTRGFAAATPVARDAAGRAPARCPPRGRVVVRRANAAAVAAPGQVGDGQGQRQPANNVQPFPHGPHPLALALEAAAVEGLRQVPPAILRQVVMVALALTILPRLAQGQRSRQVLEFQVYHTIVVNQVKLQEWEVADLEAAVSAMRPAGDPARRFPRFGSCCTASQWQTLYVALEQLQHAREALAVQLVALEDWQAHPEQYRWSLVDPQVLL